MSFDQPFSEPTIFKKRKGTTPDDPFLDIEELVSVVGGKALLTEVPYKFNRVQIIEQVIGYGSTVNVTETIDGGGFLGSSPTINETVSIGTFYETEFSPDSDNQYNVDYTEGVMTFHPSQEGSKFVVKYKGTGFHSISSHRVYTRTEGNNITETLDDVVTTGTEKITEITEKITEANEATINANNAAIDLQTLVDQQKMIYKSSVNTFADIATTYPSPQLGWTVVTKDSGIRYRYDGTSWIDIGFSTESDGFTVVVGSTPPLNKNLLWVDAPGENKNATVVQSDTPPTNTSVIWWKTT